MARKLVFLSVHHPNDFERLKYYLEFLASHNYLFLNFSSAKIIFGNARYINLYYKDSLLCKLKFFSFLTCVWLIQYLSKIVLITPYKMKPTAKSVFGRFAKMLRSVDATIWLVPHGVTTYRKISEPIEMMDADFILYNCDYELANSDLLNSVQLHKRLYRVGDLKLLKLFESQEERNTKCFKCAVLASNLNQFNLSDENRLKAILKTINFAIRNFREDEIVFRPHPRFLKFADDVKKNYPNIHIDRNVSNLPVIRESEYVFALTSSVIYEAMMLNNQLVVIEPENFKSHESMLEESPFVRFYSDELDSVELSKVQFNGEACNEWMKNKLFVERSEVQKLIDRLLSKES